MQPKSCRNESTGAADGAGTGRRSGWLRLAACTGIILVLWLAVLPRLAARPDVRRRIEYLQQQQVDPSAMFYTELEALGGIQERMASIQREHGARFWWPEGKKPGPVE